MTSSQASALLAGLAVVIVAAAVFGALARRLGQPPVVGEILAGILLGPTLFDGAVSHALLPTDIRPFLTALADVGVAVFMFLVGLEFDRGMVRGTGRIAASVSLASLLLPCGLGMALGTYLLHDHPSPNHPGFVLFMGAAMSITAFPVLARILTDRNLDHTPLGALALCCAALADVLAWSLLAVVVAIVAPGGNPERALLFLPYLLLMFYPVRWLLGRLLKRPGVVAQPTAVLLATAFAGLLVSGAATEWMGLHFIFGAFLFGAVVPRSGSERLRADLSERVGLVNNVLLLPVFFLVAGLQVDLSRLGWSDLGQLALILLVAVGGKLAGAYAGAYANGLDRRISSALAVLMNTRGLTELIILSVGRQLGILDERLYSLMVVMAVLTTAMTGPLLQAIYPRALALRATPQDMTRRRREPVTVGDASAGADRP
ncbi:cation:proton antiporter [Streptomyces hokutonensis]|uniref:cation:proton antiporter n=1 Tax=Streptomyces hokutonensis TaxID=1306990 RepID=UPI00036A4E04|nr:cation:proton antiporter [Streptomyces hokutonensis]